MPQCGMCIALAAATPLTRCSLSPRLPLHSPNQVKRRPAGRPPLCTSSICLFPCLHAPPARSVPCVPVTPRGCRPGAHAPLHAPSIATVHSTPHLQRLFGFDTHETSKTKLGGQLGHGPRRHACMKSDARCRLGIRQRLGRMGVRARMNGWNRRVGFKQGRGARCSVRAPSGAALRRAALHRRCWELLRNEGSRGTQTVRVASFWLCSSTSPTAPRNWPVPPVTAMSWSTGRLVAPCASAH